MKRTFIPLTLFILFIACGSPDTQVETDIASPVSVEEIAYKPIEEFITSTGTVKATQNVILKSETSGNYRLAINPKTSKLFALGDFVKQEQVIIYLDNIEQENTIKIESQKLNLDISKREHEKQLSLYDKGGVTLSELRNAEKANIDAQYNYDNALIQLSKLKITTPFDGIITDLPYYTQGVKVDAGTIMVQLMDYKKLNMEVQLPSRFLGQIKEGQPVRVTNYTIPDKILHGAITQVSPALDSESRTFKASTDIDNPDLLLRPGMFVKTEIIVASKDSTIVIPKDIITKRRNREIVYVVESGTAIERSISTGLENPDEVEVIEGLKTDERLVVEGFETLRNRAKVKIVR